ncbi:MAG TPA: hypothetical protein VFG87_16705 [Amycolatopsis sp.]|nr:hypothetical protein [Amycolatopsis sp.]
MTNGLPVLLALADRPHTVLLDNLDSAALEPFRADEDCAVVEVPV